MTEKFSLQRAREICEKCQSRDPYINHDYWNAHAASVLPAALDRIEELEKQTMHDCISCRSEAYREGQQSQANRIAKLEGDREKLASRLNSAEAQIIAYDEMAAQFREKYDNLEKALIEEKAKHKTGAYFWAEAPMSMKTLYLRDAREQLEKGRDFMNDEMLAKIREDIQANPCKLYKEELRLRAEHLLAHIDQQQATIDTLKTALLSDRTELVLYSPDYIVWRYHNDIDKIESQDDWKPLEVEAKAQLAREMPDIFGDKK